MQSSSRHHHIRRAVLMLGVVGAVAAPAASAQHIGDDPSQFAAVGHVTVGRAGDTPSEFQRIGRLPVQLAAPVADSPASFPGSKGFPKAEPTTIQVVRPVRTVVHDVNQALPIVLAALALLIALGAVAYETVRFRTAKA